MARLRLSTQRKCRSRAYLKTSDLNQLSQLECDGIKQTPFVSRLLVARAHRQHKQETAASAIKVVLQVDDETEPVAAVRSASGPP